jgi:hypothetical protein
MDQNQKKMSDFIWIESKKNKKRNFRQTYHNGQSRDANMQIQSNFYQIILTVMECIRSCLSVVKYR